MQSWKWCQGLVLSLVSSLVVVASIFVCFLLLSPIHLLLYAQHYLSFLNFFLPIALFFRLALLISLMHFNFAFGITLGQCFFCHFICLSFFALNCIPLISSNMLRLYSYLLPCLLNVTCHHGFFMLSSSFKALSISLWYSFCSHQFIVEYASVNAASFKYFLSTLLHLDQRPFRMSTQGHRWLFPLIYTWLGACQKSFDWKGPSRR